MTVKNGEAGADATKTVIKNKADAAFLKGICLIFRRTPFVVRKTS